MFARPDDPAEGGPGTWRDRLLRYNDEHAADNPFGLLPAAELYAHPAYGKLVRAIGLDRVFILSAGWGLIRSTFLTPSYDITFSSGAEGPVRRRKKDPYRDFQHLASTTGPVCFLGGKSYIPLFVSLTSGLDAARIVVYASRHPPNAPGCRTVKYDSVAKTNWHYLCADDLVTGRFQLT